MNKPYYVIKCLMPDDDYPWDESIMINHYVRGSSTYFDWSPYMDEARKFKSIKEIRAFITRGLKPGGNRWGQGNDINAWVFEEITTIPSSEVITASHTMELLRSVP